MFRNQTVAVVMPAYNAATTLRRTFDEVVAQKVADMIIVVDDASTDDTAAIARTLPGAVVRVHSRNRGYGANQKTCYRLALDRGADIVAMIHPDYQYTPSLLPAMVSLIGSGACSCALGSRMLGGRALGDGMPWWRYVGNRVLTWIENRLLAAHLSEFHTGYRVFSREVLTRTPIETFCDGFLFDNQMLAHIHWLGFSIGEVSCPTRYDADSSSISFRDSFLYGLGCIRTGISYRLARLGWAAPPLPSAKPAANANRAGRELFPNVPVTSVGSPAESIR